MSAVPQNLVVIHLSASAVSLLVGRQSACQTKKDQSANENKKIEIMAVGIAPTNSFYQGKIIHRDKLIAAIKTAIKDAEEMANLRIETAWLCFTSPEIISGNALGEIELTGETITNDHMVRLLGEAKKKFLPPNYHLSRFILQAIWPNGGDEVVEDVNGMAGLERLRASYHLMAMPNLSLNHLYDIAKDVNISVDDILFDVLAGSHYALIKDDNDDERSLGVLYVDIGAKSTSFCLYKQNKLIFSACLAKGGDTITERIVQECSVAPSEADRIKHFHASLMPKQNDKQIFLDIKTEGGMGVISQEVLSGVVRAGFDEIFDEILAKLFEVNLDLGYCTAGVVLSGGGSQAKGMVPYLKQKYGTAVHLVNAQKSERFVVSPKLSADVKSKLEVLLKERRLQTALGALLYCFSEEQRSQERIYLENQTNTRYLKITKFVESILAKLKKLA